MTDREKLIELIKTAKTKERCDFLFADIDDAIDMPSGDEYLADHLIANGVVISKMETLATDNNVGSKWIPVTEMLPDAWVDVLSCDRNKNLTVDCVDKKGKWYSEYEDLEEVTHWMHLPEPPKGE